MTAQIPDRLINCYASVSFGSLNLFGLTRRAPSDTHKWSGVMGPPFDYPSPPRQRTESFCTSRWRGYIATHVLESDGTLSLEAYEYESASIDDDGTVQLRVEVDFVRQRIVGNFWMILRADFYSDPTTFIPFRDGRIIEDRMKWVVQP